jgi:hypothetical protein
MRLFHCRDGEGKDATSLSLIGHLLETVTNAEAVSLFCFEVSLVIKPRALIPLEMSQGPRGKLSLQLLAPNIPSSKHSVVLLLLKDINCTNLFHCGASPV